MISIINISAPIECLLFIKILTDCNTIMSYINLDFAFLDFAEWCDTHFSTLYMYANQNLNAHQQYVCFQNSIWFGLGWCLFFFIPCIILAACLSSLYKRQQPYEKEKPFDRSVISLLCFPIEDINMHLVDFWVGFCGEKVHILHCSIQNVRYLVWSEQFVIHLYLSVGHNNYIYAIYLKSFQESDLTMCCMLMFLNTLNTVL